MGEWIRRDMTRDGEVRIPLDMPKVLADSLVAFAQAGFTFEVRVCKSVNQWIINLFR